MTTSSPARLPLQHWHTNHGARFIDSDGWQLPAVYSSVEAETTAARTGVVLADLSAFAKVSLLGHGIEAAARQLIGDEPAPPPRGVALIRPQGLGVVCRLTADHLLALASVTAPLPHGPFNIPAVVASDATSAYASFCLAGPRGEAVLQRLTALDVAALPSSSCAETGLASVHAALVRAPELSVPSLRILVAWDLAEYVWETLLDAGRDHGIIPLGLDGWRSLQVATPSVAG
jgi:glycine cleavage system aminomethyltransferase T